MNKVIEYFPNGNIKLEYTVIDGKKNGLYQEWYENGNKKYVYNYLNYCLDGLVEYWYENGQKYGWNPIG